MPRRDGTVRRDAKGRFLRTKTRKPAKRRPRRGGKGRRDAKGRFV